MTDKEQLLLQMYSSHRKKKIIIICVIIALIVIISAVCVRLYSASVLHYGKRLKFKELYRKGTEYQGEPPYAD